MTNTELNNSSDLKLVATPLIGATMRRLRRKKGLTQSDLAKILGVSDSYVNLIENIRRNITVAILLKLVEFFDIKLSEITADDGKILFSDLLDIFSDSMFSDHDLRTNDIKDFIASSPVVADSIRTLYGQYQQNKKDLELMGEKFLDAKQNIPSELNLGRSTSDAVSDLLQNNKNYFGELEHLSYKINKLMKINKNNRLPKMIEYLEFHHGVTIDFSNTKNVDNLVRKYYPEKKHLLISKDLSRKSTQFQIAQQIGLIAAKDVIERLLIDHNIDETDTLALGKTVLANYFSAALLMPYDDFFEIAEESKYDIELIENNLDTTFEQVCHRMTTLQKPGLVGIPFHLIRVDIAGNISKRFSLSGLQIPRYSVACSRWNVFFSFMNPGKIIRQISQMMDGSSYLCISRSIRKRGGYYGIPETYFSIGLGCEISYADRWIYSRGMDFDRKIPTGISCRICERKDCRHRAFPPIST